MLFLYFLISSVLQADIINEYYQKIEAAGVHIGYAIIREEFIANKNQLVVTTFTKTNEVGGSITESLKSYATADKVEPISYQYTSIVGKKTKTIDAVVRKNILYATVTEDKSKRSVQTKLDTNNNVIFSAFFVQKLLKLGLEPGKNRTFSAIVEETAKIASGRMEILEFKDNRYRILNDFNQSRFYSYLNPKGVVLETDDPISKIKTKLVNSKAEAVADITFPENVLKTLFGNIPSGINK